MIYDEEHYNQVLAVARSYRNDVERLEKQLAITEKALELACEDIDEFVGICKYCPYGVEGECPIDCPDSKNVLNDYFKTKAKEMLENE